MTEISPPAERDPGIRAMSFGAVAEQYDRYRPTYPPELVADVVARLPGRRLAEIGAGTGIATAAFAAYDLDLTCVEPDPGMAGVLRRKFVDDPRVRVVDATLEAWSASRSPDDEPFDGLISAQAWHWTHPDTRWRDAAAALAVGGLIALFWNLEGYADPAVPVLIGEVYDRHGIVDRAVSIGSEPLAATGGHVDEWPADQLHASEYFTDLEVRNYARTCRQTVLHHIARLNTVSAHLILPPDVRAGLSRDLLDVLTRHAGDELELAMTTALALARRR